MTRCSNPNCNNTSDESDDSMPGVQVICERCGYLMIGDKS